MPSNLIQNIGLGLLCYKIVQLTLSVTHLRGTKGLSRRAGEGFLLRECLRSMCPLPKLRERGRSLFLTSSQVKGPWRSTQVTCLLWDLGNNDLSLGKTAVGRVMTRTFDFRCPSRKKIESTQRAGCVFQETRYDLRVGSQPGVFVGRL